MSVETVRAAMSTAIDAITGVRSVAYITDQVTVPTAGGAYATVALGDITYDASFGGQLNVYEFIVTVWAPRKDEQRSQKLLDTLKEPSGSTSVKAALEGNAPLAALASSFQVKTASAVGEQSVGEDAGAVSYLTVDFTCEAMF